MSGFTVAASIAALALLTYLFVRYSTNHTSKMLRVVARGGALALVGVAIAGVMLFAPAALKKDTSARVSSTLQDQIAQAREHAVQDAQLRSRMEALEGWGAAVTAEVEDDEALPPENADWQVVPVFFGTDRETQPDNTRLQYSSERGRRLELGRALISVPKSHQVPNIERPWAIKLPYFDVTIYEQTEDPAQHFTIQNIGKLTQEEFLARIRTRLARSARYKDHAIVFVHGYNTSFDSALYRTAQLSYDLKFDGAAFLYSWPSGGAVASYTYDRESAQASEPYLRQFLDIVVRETGAKSVSIIAHSMGNQPLLSVLRDMRQTGPNEVAINEVILAAPDVDADGFDNVARRIEGIARGVTLYVASNDRALMVSRNFWRNPRAGDVPPGGPLIVSGVETIDITRASTDSLALNHSGYAENNDLLQDIGKLILSGLRPPEQRLPTLMRTASPRGDYWRYLPLAAGARVETGAPETGAHVETGEIPTTP